MEIWNQNVSQDDSKNFIENFMNMTEKKKEKSLTNKNSVGGKNKNPPKLSVKYNILIL